MELPADVERDIQRLDAMFRNERTLATKLEAVAELVQRSVPQCDSASISLTVQESMFTGATSSQLAIEADLVQYGVDEGPCLSSARRQTPIRVDALQHDERFVHFAPGAIEIGIESVLSMPLVSDGRTVGSFNLYSRAPSAFRPDDPERVSGLLAYAVDLIATSTLYEASVEVLARLVETVRRAGQVEIAVGLLIFTRGMSPSVAFEHLRHHAAAQGASVVDLAEDLIAQHDRGLEPPEGQP